MEQLAIKKKCIVWTVETKSYELSFAKFYKCYLKNRHFIRGKEITPHVRALMIKIGTLLFGETWWRHVDSIAAFTRIPIAHLRKITGAEKIGEGKYGTVHVYKEYAIKRVPFKFYTGLPRIDGKFEADALFHLRERLSLAGCSPNIIGIYQLSRGKECDYLVLERAETSLWQFLQEHPCERDLKSILFQVIFTIAVWQREIKHFRHNDLKTDNVLLFKRPRKKDITYTLNGVYWRIPSNTPLVKIADFDYANAPGEIENPKVGTKWALNFGCGNRGSKVYDLHLFLNSIYTHRDLLPASIKKWIEKQLPVVTRGPSTKAVKFSRLRNPLHWERIINSPENLLQSPFFGEFVSETKEYPLWGIQQ